MKQLTFLSIVNSAAFLALAIITWVVFVYCGASTTLYDMFIPYAALFILYIFNLFVIAYSFKESEKKRDFEIRKIELEFSQKKEWENYCVRIREDKKEKDTVSNLEKEKGELESQCNKLKEDNLSVLTERERQAKLFYLFVLGLNSGDKKISADNIKEKLADIQKSYEIFYKLMDEIKDMKL